ncbi:amino acid/polyamine/organocation transporter (APC superfamily) [Larkinella arboricola]|uniref:Amino acid/polyamine/organocation transporter (APC superfamily) n=2 Tax=Larkinella arboricola TaxID=643671 RepID=A0A327WWF8_LARAB|nr:amino acid/polyamine/organocation transporter (APC superfamily) [Larkinella arboricola]
MIDMVGIGPFVVLPLVIQLMGGPHFLWAWILGAVISLIDALVWSELGAAYPQAGGSYNFLKIAYGENRWGKLLSFLYVWQTMIQAPLVVASGAIGFAQYASYLIPFDEWQRKAVSGGVVILITMLLYRKIESIGRISILLWVCVLATLGWIIWGGLTGGQQTVSLAIPSGEAISGLFGAGLGIASVKTIYCYLGYYNVCHLGGEIRNPSRIIPISMLISVIGIAVLYLAMNWSVVKVIPWQEAQHSEFIISAVIERLYGTRAGSIATFMVLIVAFSSLFAVLLGYSRVPYAAAADGQFFPVFAKLHPTRHFPYISLLFLGALGFGFSLLFRLSDVITAILAMRIVVQFIGQAIGLLLLHRRKQTGSFPFRMPLYPLPVLLVIGIWTFIFISTGQAFMVSGLTVIGLGIVVYLITARIRKQWPFDAADQSASPLVDPAEP